MPNRFFQGGEKFCRGGRFPPGDGPDYISSPCSRIYLQNCKKASIYTVHLKLRLMLQSRAKYIAGVANTSMAIDRSIAETQLIDRTWFCIELTRYLRRKFFIQYFRKLYKNKNVVFYDILYFWLIPTDRSRVINKFSSRSLSKTSWPSLIYSICSTPELSERNICDCLKMKFPSPLGGIQQAVHQKQFRKALLLVLLSLVTTRA